MKPFDFITDALDEPRTARAAPPAISEVLDDQRLDAIDEIAAMAGDLAASVSQAAAAGDPIRTRVYLTLLSRSVANALQIAAQLGKAEACA